MTEQPDDIVILRLLQDIRAEASEMRAQIGVLTQGQLGIRSELNNMSGRFALMNGHMIEIAIALDHYTHRLDRIEQHLGLGKPRH